MSPISLWSWANYCKKKTISAPKQEWANHWLDACFSFGAEFLPRLRTINCVYFIKQQHFRHWIYQISLPNCLFSVTKVCERFLQYILSQLNRHEFNMKSRSVLNLNILVRTLICISIDGLFMIFGDWSSLSFLFVLFQNWLMTQ